jgi:hypothetical protein
MHKPRVGGTLTRKPKAKPVTKPKSISPVQRWGANGQPYLGGKKKEEVIVAAAPALDEVPVIDPYLLPVVNDDELTVFDIDEPKEEGEPKSGWKAKRDKKKAEQPAEAE